MSISNDPASGQNQQTSGEPENNQQPENQVSYDSHRKLLGEKKKVQDELNTLRAEKEAREQKELEATGQHEEVIKKLREQLADTEAKHKTTTEKVAYDKFSSQVSRVAKEMGCVDTRTLNEVMTQAQMAGVQLDDKLNANGEDLTRLIEEMKQDRPALFGTSKVNHTAFTGNTGFKKPEPKGLHDMSKEELIASLKIL